MGKKSEHLNSVLERESGLFRRGEVPRWEGRERIGSGGGREENGSQAQAEL